MTSLNLPPEVAEALAQLEAARAHQTSTENALREARQLAVRDQATYAALRPLRGGPESPECHAAALQASRSDAVVTEAFRADCAARAALQAASTPEALEAERSARRAARRNPLRQLLEEERAARREARQALKPLKEKLEAERSARREARRARREREEEARRERYEREAASFGVLIEAALESLQALHDRPPPEDPDALFELHEALRELLPILHKCLT